MRETLRDLFMALVGLMATVIWIVSWFGGDFQQTVLWGIAVLVCQVGQHDAKTQKGASHA